MSYLPARRPVAVGFTEDEEKELLRRSAEAEEWRKKQDQLGTARTAAIGLSMLYILIKTGDIVSQMRARRRTT